MIFIKLYKLIISTLLICVTIFPCYGTELINTWVNIDDSRTRIMFQFDTSARYQIQYIPESKMLSIYFPETDLGNVNKAINISNEMLETVTLRDIPENMVEINILLKKNTYFSIAPLEQPNQIAVDIMKEKIHTIINKAQVTDRSKGVPVSGDESLVKDDVNNHIKPGIYAKITSKFKSINYPLIQAFISVIIIFGLIFVSLKIRRLSVVLKNPQESLKRNYFFADIINGIHRKNQKQASKENSKLNIIDNFKKNIPDRDIYGQENPYQDKYKKIQKLARQGINRFEISKRSNIPIGEVNLILDLPKVKPKRQN